MLFRFLTPNLLKLVAILIAPGAITAAALTVWKPKDPNRMAWFFCGALFGLIEIGLVIDKGAPFLLGNIYHMASMDPKWWIAAIIGVTGDGLWYWRSVRRAQRWNAKWSGKSRASVQSANAG